MAAILRRIRLMARVTVRAVRDLFLRCNPVFVEKVQHQPTVSTGYDEVSGDRSLCMADTDDGDTDAVREREPQSGENGAQNRIRQRLRPLGPNELHRETTGLNRI